MQYLFVHWKKTKAEQSAEKIATQEQQWAEEEDSDKNNIIFEDDFVANDLLQNITEKSVENNVDAECNSATQNFIQNFGNDLGGTESLAESAEKMDDSDRAIMLALRRLG